MNPFTLSTFRQTRKNISQLIDAYSIEELNVIPKGFSNNLIWNFGHVLVTQQLLCYKRAGLEMLFEDEFVDRYRKGSKPTTYIPLKEYQRIKDHFLSSVDQFEQDLQEGKFDSYQSYPTSYGLELTNISEAGSFNNVHEAMHFGSMLGIRKFL